MTLRDIVGFALRGIRRRFGRAVLTLVSVALAATLLTALLIIARTAESRVLGQLSKGGPLAGIQVSAAEPGPEGVGTDNPGRGDKKPIDETTVQAIRALPDVRQVTPVISARLFLDPEAPAAGEPGSDVRGFVEDVLGVDLGRAANLPISVTSGRLPSVGSSTEIAVTETYLKRIGLDRTQSAAALGRTVVIAAGRSAGGDTVQGRWIKTVIVGVVTQQAAGGIAIMSIEPLQAATRWQTSGLDGGPIEKPTTLYSGLFVEAASLDRVGAVRISIADLGFATSAPESLIATVQRYLRVVEIVLSSIGLIAVGIAAIGITNAMLAAVRERRREIGVIKAIGARDRDVLGVFLVEAGLLGFIGGTLGALLGWTLARTVGAFVNRYLVSQGLVGVALSVPPFIIVLAIIGSTVLALTAGIVPARRAARLSAREAVDAG